MCNQELSDWSAIFHRAICPEAEGAKMSHGTYERVGEQIGKSRKYILRSLTIE